jgi:hypothetical protein
MCGGIFIPVQVKLPGPHSTAAATSGDACQELLTDLPTLFKLLEVRDRGPLTR